MFTGLIREVGRIRALKKRGEGTAVEIEAPVTRQGLEVGDSVAVDGVCLTAESVTLGGFTAYISGESLSRTTLGSSKAGTAVNIEPSLKAGDPIGGHFVQGHAEDTGKVISLALKGEEALLKVEIPRKLMDAVVEKGSIAISGVSLTIAKASGNVATVAVVPHTLKTTTLGKLKRGSLVNVETDIIARQVASNLEKKKGLTVRDLTEEGF